MPWDRTTIAAAWARVLRVAGTGRPEQEDLHSANSLAGAVADRAESALCVLTSVQRPRNCSRRVADKVTRPMPPPAARDGPSLAILPAALPIRTSLPRT